MQIRPNSAVGIARRLEERGLIERQRGTGDRRQVFVTLTNPGRALLERLAAAHKAELQKAAPAFDVLLRQLDPPSASPGKERVEPRVKD
jgi:DNA-binding MarR family transcriptional regulator